VINSVVRGVRQPTLNNDTQAITAYNSAGPLTVEGNYLSAAGETILFGGADPKIANMIPSDIVIRGNVITKDVAWQTARNQVKNLLELKNARRVTIDGNLLENCWPDAQDGTAVLYTVRNQEGTAPWSTIEDVTFTNNIVRHAANAFNILGHDDDKGFLLGSGRATRIVIRNNLVTDIGSAKWATRLGSTTKDSTSAITINDGIVDSTIEANTIAGLYTTFLKLSLGKTKTASTNLRIVNNAVNEGKYGVIADGMAPGITSWAATTDLASVLDGNLFARTAVDNYKYPGLNVKSLQGERSSMRGSRSWRSFGVLGSGVIWWRSRLSELSAEWSSEAGTVVPPQRNVSGPARRSNDHAASVL
jgi:hypothetical protein